MDHHLHLAIDGIKSLLSQIDSFPSPDIGDLDTPEIMEVVKENLEDLKNRTLLLQASIDPEFDPGDDIVVHDPGM